MSILLGRTSAVMLSACAFFGSAAGAAYAVPTHAQVVPRPVVAAAGRLERAPLVVHSFVAPALHEHIGAAPPLTAAPLTAPRTPAASLPALLPRLAFASFLPAAAVDACRDGRSPLLIGTLPATPFVASSCISDTAPRELDDRLTSLTPAGNKNALYGPGYAPHDLGEGP